ncbi:extracellular solute-binding protein, partial [Rhizobiaceae sp. 2RAB30]
MRRRIIKLAGLLSFCAATTLAINITRADVSEVRVIDTGGSSTESFQKGYADPFTGKTGIKVTFESPASLGKLRAMIEAKNITADLIELTSSQLEQAKALDLLEPLDWAAIDPDPIFDEARDGMGLGWQYFSTVISWRKGEKPISTWKEFWDTESFPGKRALPDDPSYILPMAL